MLASAVLTLVEYHRWANAGVLRRAVHLTDEQLVAPCWLSQGTLVRTLIHILDAQWSWRCACQEGSIPVERLSEETFADLRALWAYWQDEDAKLVR